MDWQERRSAAATLRECRQALASRGGTVIAEIAGGDAVVDWRHYPDGEVYDPRSQAQYFYHAHPAADPAKAAPSPEHGHFHLFLRGEGIPPGMMPLLLPELAVAKAAPQPPPSRRSAPLKRGLRDEVCHLVAIAVDARGEPIRLLATNRWVTGETWYRADDVIAMLDRCRLPPDGKWGLVNRWIGAVLCLFRPEIAALLQERDKAVLERRWRWRTNVLEDPRLEIAASITIDLDARLLTVEAEAAGVEPTAAAVPPRLRLPRMAEGWGA